MSKIKKHNEATVEDEAGAAILGLAAIAGLGLWAWRRKKAQPVGPAFALVPSRNQGQRVNQGQGQRVSQMILPRGDFIGPQGTDRSEFGFAF